MKKQKAGLEKTCAARKIKNRRSRVKKALFEKALLCFAAIILILIFSIGLSSNFAEAYEPQYNLTVDTKTEKCYKSIQLTYGDTLWEIAGTYMDESYESIPDYIDELKEINGLTSDEIHAGHYLTVVYYASHS